MPINMLAFIATTNTHLLLFWVWFDLRMWGEELVGVLAEYVMNNSKLSHHMTNRGFTGHEAF